MKKQCYYSIDLQNNTIINVSLTQPLCEELTKNYMKIFKIPKNMIARGMSTADIPTTMKQLRKDHR